jgi:hypothetical protein
MSAIAHRAAMLPLADSRDRTVYLVLDPLRVVAFNTADRWMRDVTADIRTRAAGRSGSPSGSRDFAASSRG